MHAKIVTKALIAASAMLAATSAVAGSPSDARITKSVSYADLDLSTNNGRQMLRQRVNLAAREVCWTAVDEQIIRHQQWGECRQRSFASARRAMVSMFAAAPSSTDYASADSKFISVGTR